MTQATKLYQPEKYKVYLGKGRSSGLCTVWNEPETVFNKSKIIRDNSVMLGTLYSRQGVSIILRNLALNPQIRTVYLWGNGALSNTKFGIAGRTTLTSLWQKGISDDGIVSGTQFKIEKEIDANTVKKIISNVELADVSDKSIEDVEKLLTLSDSNEKSGPYMKPVEFPETAREQIDIFPSEEVGWLMRGKTITESWLKLVERIMRYGTTKGTQYGYQQRELIGATWVSNEPDPEKPDFSLAENWPNSLKELAGTTPESIKEYYRNVLMSPEMPSGISYTYGNRLMAYPNPNDGQPIDQIKEILIKNLTDSPDSRRAVATTMVPVIDKDSKEPPCITQIQAIQSRGRLHFLVTVRSHDIFKAAIPNAFGLRTLQKKVTRELGFELGELQITSQSAHIYEQDWDQALKLSRCFFWERKPELVFDPERHADPRGNMIITIKESRINVEFQSPSGAKLMDLQGENAKELSMQIALLELLSRFDHIMDVAMELQKAETAMKNKLAYNQDRPLSF